eukprot:m.442549 g.442549  ORF g.442549 m.442549 type:complete len:758 (+) comp21476_c0_seq12:92-2365(+)
MSSSQRGLPRCVVCGSENFVQNEDGFFVCEDCDTQSQDLGSLQLEERTVFHTQRHTRRPASKRKKKLSNEQLLERRRRANRRSSPEPHDRKHDAYDNYTNRSTFLYAADTSLVQTSAVAPWYRQTSSTTNAHKSRSEQESAALHMPTTMTMEYPVKDSAAAILSIGAAVVKTMATAIAVTGCVHSRHFDTVVGQLWTRLASLKLSHLSDIRHQLPSDATFESRAREDVPHACYTESGDAVHAAVTRALVSPLEALQVCCIALRLCRAAILYPDIVAMATTGRLPLYTLLHDMEKKLLRCLSIRYHYVMRYRERRQYLSCHTLRSGVAGMWEQLFGKDCRPTSQLWPPLIASACLDKYYSELSIPAAVADVANVLAHAIPPQLATTPSASGALRTASSIVPDTVVLLSYIVVGFKIVFSLDDDQHAFAVRNARTRRGPVQPTPTARSQDVPGSSRGPGSATKPPNATLDATTCQQEARRGTLPRGTFLEWARSVGDAHTQLAVSAGVPVARGAMAALSQINLSGQSLDNLRRLRPNDTSNDAYTLHEQAYACKQVIPEDLAAYTGWCHRMFAPDFRKGVTQTDALQDYGVRFRAFGAAMKAKTASDAAARTPASTDGDAPNNSAEHEPSDARKIVNNIRQGTRTSAVLEKSGYHTMDEYCGSGLDIPVALRFVLQRLAAHVLEPEVLLFEATQLLEAALTNELIPCTVPCPACLRPYPILGARQHHRTCKRAPSVRATRPPQPGAEASEALPPAEFTP